MPLSLLHHLDPAEPLFKQGGWHPAVLYQEVSIRVGQPLAIDSYRQHYAGRQATTVVRDLTATISQQVNDLLAA